MNVAQSLRAACRCAAPIQRQIQQLATRRSNSVVAPISTFQHTGCRLLSRRQRLHSSLIVASSDVDSATEVMPSGEETAPSDVQPALPVSQLDIRVGRILEISKHPDADSLYVEQVDVGEGEPRTIISGLVEFVPLEQMQGRSVIVLCNLKPRNMRGIKSHGMLMCASNAAHDSVEPLDPPAGAATGERVFFGEDGAAQPAAESPNKIQKKKIWEELQPSLKTDQDGVAQFDGVPMLTSAGPVRAASLVGASIS